MHRREGKPKEYNQLGIKTIIIYSLTSIGIVILINHKSNDAPYKYVKYIQHNYSNQ